ncbi:MAG: hypothetical protein Q7U54_12870 [Bacteroidales bacterium]|nr:hypothetical protein [Bacteroidales bacterium]
MKIRLLLTFDHELPLGSLKSSYKKALFDPTERLFESSKRNDFPVNLFTDVLCALRYKEWDNEGFYKPYTNQLHKAIELGHDVQLHLHPHWLTSGYEKGVVIPSGDYSLANFASNNEQGIGGIVKMGTTLLEEVCREAKSDYKVLAFRAGGYNIEPGSKEIFTELAKNGIKYDSSVVLKYYFVSSLSLIDFRKIPVMPNWYIGSDGDFRKSASSGILEIPVAAIPKTPFEIPTRFKLKHFALRSPESHGSMIHEGNPGSRMEQLRMLFSSRMLTFDNHTLSAKYLMRILAYNIQKFKHFETLNLATCSHPKTMGDYSFTLMEQFIHMAREKYPDIEFTTFERLHKQNLSD